MLEDSTSGQYFHCLFLWHVALGRRAGMGLFPGMAAAPELILVP